MHIPLHLNIRLIIKLGISLAAAILLFGAGYAVSAVSIPDAKGVFHACVNNSTGATRIVPRAKRCKVSSGVERAVWWKQTTPSPINALPSGKTLTGLIAIGFHADAAGEVWRPSTSFAIPLKNPIAFPKNIYVPGSSAPHCPGLGKADPGYLCLYQQRLVGALNQPTSVNIGNVDDPIGGSGVGRHGFNIYLTSSGAGNADFSGVYAVTAP